MGTPSPTGELQQPQPQALHYALANAQQVQIHQIGEDGQVQVVCALLPDVSAGCGEAAPVVGAGGRHTDSFLQRRRYHEPLGFMGVGNC
jgi:hypothetical protein